MDEGEIRELLNDHLSAFYTDYVLPLENQLKKLGHTPERAEDKEYSFTPKLIGGMFLDNNDNPIFDNILQYFGNLNMLLYQKGLIYKNDYSNFIDAFVGIGVKQGTIVRWLGQENLCVYMIDKLIDKKVITDRKKNICIEKIFGIKNVAQKRDSYQKNKNVEPFGKPKGYQVIDEVIEKAFDNKSIMFGDVLDANFNKPLPK